MSSLFFGARIILYEGSPAYPSLEGFVEKLKEKRPHVLGTSPKFLKALEDNSSLESFEDFENLETILSTGAPLESSQYSYVYRLKKDVQLSSCLLYTSPSPRDQRGSRMPSSA